jgi:uncharacterized C2H2 Zn-finger protein
MVVAEDSFENKGVQSIKENVGDGLLKCTICGVKFNSANAFEGHVAAGHISASNPYEGEPSGLGHLAKTPYMCDVCGRGFPEKEEYDTHRLQH